LNFHLAIVRTIIKFYTIFTIINFQSARAGDVWIALIVPTITMRLGTLICWTGLVLRNANFTGRAFIYSVSINIIAHLVGAFFACWTISGCLTFILFCWRRFTRSWTIITNFTIGQALRIRARHYLAFLSASSVINTFFVRNLIRCFAISIG